MEREHGYDGDNRMKKEFSTATRKTGTNRIVVRPARPGDAPQVAALSGQLGYPVSASAMRHRLGIVARRKNHKIFVAERDATIEGWLEVFRPLSVLNWGKGEVGALVVDSASRRGGIGSQLMVAARLWAERQRCSFIYLRSNVIRDDAHRFYRKSGYAVYKTQSVFRLLLNNTKKRKR